MKATRGEVIEAKADTNKGLTMYPKLALIEIAPIALSRMSL
jgi:hypothetical protein